MRMKISAVGILLAVTAACGGEGDDDYVVSDSSVIGGDAAFGQPDAQMPGAPEGGTVLDAAGGAPEAGPARDASAASDASSASDGGAADASSSMDAGGDASVADAGASDAGSSSDAGNDAGNVDAGGAVTFTRVYALFQTPCIGCHGATARGGLNMSNKNGAHMELTSPGNAEGASCASGNRKRVVPGMPDASLLIKKLEGTQDCGERMPEGRAALTAAQIAEVRAWITAGALNN